MKRRRRRQSLWKRTPELPLKQTHFKNRVTKIILPASLYLTVIGSMNFREATVHFENTKLGVAQLEYDIKQVDPKIIQKTAQEIKAFTGKTLKTTKATRVKSKMKEVKSFFGLSLFCRCNGALNHLYTE
ncbi:hypothetical protein EX87_06830 [Brevibacillus laterosporus]|uniref:Uncharacterized protein n=1 Tax=Brevibacillus laterosporus TaxID=1465 RepID=A0A0F6XZ93_BRELA|nr:hypothetical protein EX87_06830 [Brevibacillus laterosporus]